MNDLPPELRQALISLLIETLHQLARLLAAVLADILGIKTLPLPEARLKG